MSNRGGIYWSKILPATIPNLRQWSDVVLNDSQVNGPENVVTDPLAEFMPRTMNEPHPRLWLSINALSVFIGEDGTPSVYWPMQGRIHAAAERVAGWMTKPNYVNSQIPVEESAPWGRMRFLDLSNRPLCHVLAFEMATAARDPRIHGLFLDEAHSTIADIRGRHPGVTITDAAWRDGLRWTLRQYGLLMGGRPKPTITNGTFGREHSAMVTGRFWQATRAADLPAKVADAEGAGMTMLHSCGDMATPADLARAAERIDAGCWQWTPTNGPFVYDWIPEAVTDAG